MKAHVVEIWMSVFGQHRYETNGFSLKLHALTDAELLNLKPVTRQFLEMCPRIGGIIHPKTLPEYRRAVAYLSDLCERQSAVMEREYERMGRETRALERVIKTIENAPITNEDKINFVKKHFGWE